MKQYLKEIDKETIYDTYYILEEDPIDYDRITRFKVHDLVNKMLRENPIRLPYIISEEDFDILLEAAKESKENGFVVMTKYELYTKYYRISFAFDDYEKDIKTSKLFMSKEIEDFLLSYKETNEIKNMRDFETFIKGMVETHGMVPFDFIDETYHEETYDSKDHEFGYSIHGEPYLMRKLEVSGYIPFKDYMFHHSILEHNINIDIDYPLSVYDFDFYMDMGKYRTESKFKEIFRNEGHKDYELEHLIDRTYLDLQDHPNPMLLLDSLIETLEFSKPLELSFLWFRPLWRYGGMNAVDKMQESEQASLEPEKKEPFLLYTQELVAFANKKYNVIDIRQYYDADDVYHVLVNTLEEQDLMPEFIASREYTKTRYNEEFENSFKNARIISEGFAYKYEEGVLLVYADDCVYYVYGHMASLEFGISSMMLPTYMDLIILPFNDKLMTTSMVHTVNRNTIDSKIIRTYIEEIQDALEVRNIFDVERIQNKFKMN